MTTTRRLIIGFVLASLGQNLRQAAIASSAFQSDVWRTTAIARAPGNDANPYGGFAAQGDHETALISYDGIVWLAGHCADWTARQSRRSVARGAGILVKAGPTSAIETSTDGVRWIVRSSGVPNRLHSVAYGRSVFVVVGNEGALVTSRNGIAWTSRNAHTDERLRGVAYGKGQFVVVGYEGTILTSRNGRRWVRRQSGTEERLLGVAFGNDRFVAVGWNGVLLSSSDGKTWTRRQSGTKCNLTAVNYHPEASPEQNIPATEESMVTPSLIAH
jgi:hypothetical protein